MTDVEKRYGTISDNENRYLIAERLAQLKKLSTESNAIYDSNIRCKTFFNNWYFYQEYKDSSYAQMEFKIVYK